MTERPDEFISALLRDGSSGAADVDLDSAYAGVTRRVQHVRRRRVALVSGAACVALFGAVVFAGSRMGTSDDVRPGGPATDLRGNLTPDSIEVTTITHPGTTVTEPVETAPPTVVVAAEKPAGVPPATSTLNHSGNGGGPNTTGGGDGPGTTFDDGDGVTDGDGGGIDDGDGVTDGSGHSGSDDGSGESHGG